MNKICKDKWASAHWSAARNKIGRCPADKPVTNHEFCSFIGLHGILVIRAAGDSFRTVVHDAWGVKRVGRLLGEHSRRRPVLLRPCLPRRCAVRHPAPPRSWFMQLLDSAGFRTIYAIIWSSSDS